VLREFGLGAGHRILFCLIDSIDFHTIFLGAIKAGVVPVPLNTLWTSSDYAHVLIDSGAAAAVVSEVRLSVLLDAAQSIGWRWSHYLVGEQDSKQSTSPLSIAGFRDSTSRKRFIRPDDVCFGCIPRIDGQPKAAVPSDEHGDDCPAVWTRRLGVNETDVTYSAAKLFFAYGLGNSLSFPLYTGATAVLLGGRVLPPVVNAIVREKRPTLFCGVQRCIHRCWLHPICRRLANTISRLCFRWRTPAGTCGVRVAAADGVEIVDAPGSTEMLHCFISNQPGAVRYGTSGRPVPGYKVKLVSDDGSEVDAGDIGELWVSVNIVCVLLEPPGEVAEYLRGGWTRTGDKYRQDSAGDLVFCGRADDMLKVGGIWVSPMEVESALACHETVLEAAVIGSPDENGLVKPRAFVVVKPGIQADDELKQKLKDFVKDKLAPYKYPRWVQFVPELPKTATGKIQRFRLREMTREDT
jgi:benzoate-CoA ligase